jgi:hypothetical protein
MLVMQMCELFPEASEMDITRTKALLKQYKEKKHKLEHFNKKPPENAQQQEAHSKLITFTRLIETAVDQILEPDVKTVLEYRFIKGNSRAATMLRFSGWNCCDKTIDRKILDGIESVANTLLYL